MRLLMQLTGALGRRCVTTWSPLAATFNTKPLKNTARNLVKPREGLFKIPQLKEFSGFYLLQESATEHAEKLIAEATSPNRKRKMVQIFDDLSDVLCQVADMADFVRSGHPDPNYAQAAQEACANISGLVERLNTNVDLYNALKQVHENGDGVPMDDIDKRVTKLFLIDFEQSGIHLEQKKRERYVDLNNSILELGTFFTQGCQAPNTMPKKYLPEHLQHCFSLEGDNVVINSFFADHHNDLVREAAYKIFLHPRDHQSHLLDSLLSARDQLAKLVGFTSYSHRAQNNTVLETPENVMQFLKLLAENVKTYAKMDLDIIKDMKKKHNGKVEDVFPWDPPYYTAMARHDKCVMDSAELSPYFSLGACMEGLNSLFLNLFGVSLIYEDPGSGEVWHPLVHKVSVVHQTEGPLGYIYCDFFERTGKMVVDCHYTIRGGRELASGQYQLPIVVLNLNFPPPSLTMPSLLTPGMVENLFHEFGHAMHSMLGRTKYQHVTGTRCSTDFAEVPSVLMEYFASDPRVLSTFARHYKTGAFLPPEILESMCSTKKMFMAIEKQLQIVYSMMDLLYHGEHPLHRDTTEILRDIQNQYYIVPHVTGTAAQLRFGHLVGYGAKYYSYLLSRAVASRIWHKMFKDDPFSRTSGDKYRHKLLAHGGGKPPTEIIGDVLNEELTLQKLVDSLVTEVRDAYS
ncbi:mitochondrial intermediate peptidase-like [Lineus longissimus]|uniref:mitochondrial intermediate peptidase-like n=1 Tax=Lineus longissimus TaxID=88925 RepID=UPI002B4D112C